MMWLGIAIMAVGFIGVLVCAKIKNQPLQVGAAVVMLVGLGIYFYAYMNKDQAYARDWVVYRMAVANAVAKELNGAKAVWITSDMESETSKEIQDAFTKFGGNAEYKSVTSAESGMVDSKAFADALKTLTKDNYLVLDISMMEGGVMKPFATLLKSSNCPKIILTDNASGMDGKMLGIAKAFKDGKIVAAISHKTGDIDLEFHPDEDNLDEAFNARYIVIKADNFDANKGNFGYESK